MIVSVGTYLLTSKHKQGGFFGAFCMYFVQHSFICRPLGSTVSEDAGIKPRNVATLAIAVRCSKHLGRSHPYHAARSHPQHSARSHPRLGNLIHTTRLDLIHTTRLDLVHTTRLDLIHTTRISHPHHSARSHPHHSARSHPHQSARSHPQLGLISSIDTMC